MRETQIIFVTFVLCILQREICLLGFTISDSTSLHFAHLCTLCHTFPFFICLLVLTLTTLSWIVSEGRRKERERQVRIWSVLFCGVNCSSQPYYPASEKKKEEMHARVKDDRERRSVEWCRDQRSKQSRE